MKKFVALMTALCMAAVPRSAAADGDPIEESFENSVIYSVYDSEKRTFAPDDFENVKCEKAEIISMEKNDYGTYDYKLLLTVGTTADEAVNILGETAEKNSYSKDRKSDNIFYLAPKSVDIPLGGAYPIFIGDISGYTNDPLYTVGVYFAVDAQEFDENLISNKTFLTEEASRVFAVDGQDELKMLTYSILANQTSPNSLAGKADGKISGTHNYIAVHKDGKNNREIMEKLIELPGITKAYIYVFTDELTTFENQDGYYATIENEQIAEIPYTRDKNGEILDRYKFPRPLKRPQWLSDQPYSDPVIWIEGKEVGTTKLNATATYHDTLFYGEAEINVYILQGDVNLNGKVEVVDALIALQYTVKKTELNQNQITAAKFGGRNDVTVTDALCILRRALNQ